MQDQATDKSVPEEQNTESRNAEHETLVQMRNWWTRWAPGASGSSLNSLKTMKRLLEFDKQSLVRKEQPLNPGEKSCCEC